MARAASFLAGLALLVPNVISVPIYIQEECSCQPLRPGGSNDSASLAECQLVAARVQTTRAHARNLPYLTDIWVDDNKVLHVDVPSRHTSPAEEPFFLSTTADTKDDAAVSRNPTFKSALDKMAWLTQSHSQSDSQSRSQERPCHKPSRRRSPTASSVREQLDSRHSPQPQPQPDAEEQREAKAAAAAEAEAEERGYSIVCRAQALAPHHYRGHRSDGAWATHMVFIGISPLLMLFIFLAMILACTTIIDCVLETWQRYAVRIRLEGPEQVIYALPAEERQQRPRRREDEADDVEKAASAKSAQPPVQELEAEVWMEKSEDPMLARQAKC